MAKPAKYDFINIHDHGALPHDGVFTIENLMIHEARYPEELRGIAYSAGIHPWEVEKETLEDEYARLRELCLKENVIAVGEAGYDKLKGPELLLQDEAFRMQVALSEELGKPLFIHCVRAWDDLLHIHKKIAPAMKWIIHGFRGKAQLASQLIDKGFFLSPWVEWAIRPDSAVILRSIPRERLFLETDGFDIGIEPVYKVVAEHLGITSEELKKQLWENYMYVFDS